MPVPLRIPVNLSAPIDAHKKWLRILEEVKSLIAADNDLQKKAAKGLRLRGRQVAPEVLGGTYASYCSLINRMYEAYLASEHLQRAPYISDMISVLMRRLFELRNELVKLIVNDYIYLDGALIRHRLTPSDIEIVFPYHLAIEARKDSVEELLQNMWADSIERLTAPVMVHASTSALYNRRLSAEMAEEAEETPAPVESEPIILPEEYIQATIIQSHERYRQYFMKDYRAKCIRRRNFFAQNMEPAAKFVLEAAARLIQQVYRRYMEIKRKRVKDHERNVFMGMVPDPWKPRLNFKEEDRKLYMFRRRLNERTREAYLKEMEAENTRVIMMKKDLQIEDISEQIREWFMEWFYGYEFLPEYPYPAEGGTIMVIRGVYPTIAEKIEEDEKLAAATKGKTKEMLKNEKKQAKFEAIAKAIAEKEAAKNEAEQEYKRKCNPFADPGYKVKPSQHMESLADALRNYNGSWSMYDKMSPEHCGEIVYGFIKPIITEDVMSKLHVDCRTYVDEFMRLEWKLLLDAHKATFEYMGWKFPPIKPRPKPPVVKPPNLLTVDSELLQSFEYLFDLGIISKSTQKIEQIIGDLNYAAYDCNVADPHSSFPLPGYGDIRRRLVFSCVYGSGIEPGAARKKAVLLVGPPRNGKSFLVDCVVGEMNAVKFDVSPEVFSAVVKNPRKAIRDVFQAARVFQPCVIFMKNVERVFIKKIPPNQRYLKAKKLKAALVKCVNKIDVEDKIIFIATCSVTTGYQPKRMLAIFDELILVPRADYSSLQMFFYSKLQSIRSAERDFCVQPIAQLLHGYGFGAVIEAYHRVMTPERIVRLNVTPLSVTEFTDALEEYEKLTVEDYKLYENFVLNNSPLRAARAELMDINIHRADAYEMMAKRMQNKQEQEQ